MHASEFAPDRGASAGNFRLYQFCRRLFIEGIRRTNGSGGKRLSHAPISGGRGFAMTARIAAAAILALGTLTAVAALSANDAHAQTASIVGNDGAIDSSAGTASFVVDIDGASPPRPFLVVNFNLTGSEVLAPPTFGLSATGAQTFTTTNLTVSLPNTAGVTPAPFFLHDNRGAGQFQLVVPTALFADTAGDPTSEDNEDITINVTTNGAPVGNTPGFSMGTITSYTSVNATTGVAEFPEFAGFASQGTVDTEITFTIVTPTITLTAVTPDAGCDTGCEIATNGTATFTLHASGFVYEDGDTSGVEFILDFLGSVGVDTDFSVKSRGNDDFIPGAPADGADGFEGLGFAITMSHVSTGGALADNFDRVRGALDGPLTIRQRMEVDRVVSANGATTGALDGIRVHYTRKSGTANAELDQTYTFRITSKTALAVGNQIAVKVRNFRTFKADRTTTGTLVAGPTDTLIHRAIRANSPDSALSGLEVAGQTILLANGDSVPNPFRAADLAYSVVLDPSSVNEADIDHTLATINNRAPVLYCGTPEVTVDPESGEVTGIGPDETPTISIYVTAETVTTSTTCDNAAGFAALTDDNENTTAAGNITLYTLAIRVASADAMLSDLTVNGVSLTLVSGIFMYNANIASASTATTGFEVSATPRDGEGQVTEVTTTGTVVTPLAGSAGGPHTFTIGGLSAGPNPAAFVITVTAEDTAVTEMYTVNVGVGSNNAVLTGFTVDEEAVTLPTTGDTRAGTIRISGDGIPLEFTPTLPTGATLVLITVTNREGNPVADATSATAFAALGNVTEEDGTYSVDDSGTNDIMSGNNTITVQVQAEDGVTSITYTITVSVDGPAADIESITVTPAAVLPATTPVIPETNGSARIVVRLDNPVRTGDPDVTLPFTFVNPGTNPATLGADYEVNTDGSDCNPCDGTTATPGMLTFTAPEQEQTIVIDTITDFTDEMDEGFIFRLTPGTEEGVTVFNNEVTITIADDDTDPTAVSSVVASPDSIREDGGTSTITITLDHAATVDVTVLYNFMDNSPTALLGTNFTANPSSSLTIMAGQRSGTIAIAAIADDDEDEEIIIITVPAADNTSLVALDITEEITISEINTEAEVVKNEVETVTTIIGATQVGSISGLIRARFTSPVSVVASAPATPDTATALHLPDNPQDLGDMLNGLGLEHTADADGGGVYAVWARGTYTSMEGDPTVNGMKVDYDGDSTGLGIGVEKVTGRYVAGVAMNWLTTDLDLRTEDAEGLSKYEESLLMVAPYLALRRDNGRSFWISAGYGVGDADGTTAEDGTTASADVNVSFLNAGADFVITMNEYGELVGSLSVLGVRKTVDAFTFEGVDPISQTSLTTFRGQGEVTYYRNIGAAGGRVRPYIGLATLHDAGDKLNDDSHALDLRGGGEFRGEKINASLEVSTELLRKDHKSWTISGSARYLFSPEGLGASLTLDGSHAADSDMGLEGGYGMPMRQVHRDALLTPFAGMRHGSGSGEFSSGMRLAIGSDMDADLRAARRFSDDEDTLKLNFRRTF